MSTEEDFDGCDICGEGHDTEDCPELYCEAPCEKSTSRARLTVPFFVAAVDQPDGSVSVHAMETIKAKTKLGPFEATRTTLSIDVANSFVLRLLSKDGLSVTLDTSNENTCNWLCLVQTALTAEMQNCMALQIGTDIYYTATRDIASGEELLVWYAPHYARKLGKPPQPDGLTKTLLNINSDKGAEKFQAEVADDTFPQAMDANDTLEAKAIKQEPTEAMREAEPVKDLALADPAFASHPGTDVPLQCMKTLNTLNSPRDLHIVHRASSVGMRQCTRCKQQFEGLKELAKHIKEHILEREKTGGRRGRTKSVKQEEDGEKQARKSKRLMNKLDTDEVESPLKSLEVEQSKSARKRRQSKEMNDAGQRDITLKDTGRDDVKQPRVILQRVDDVKLKSKQEVVTAKEKINTPDDLPDGSVRRSGRVSVKKFSVAKVMGLRVKEEPSSPVSRNRISPQKSTTVSKRCNANKRPEEEESSLVKQDGRRKWRKRGSEASEQADAAMPKKKVTKRAAQKGTKASTEEESSSTPPEAEIKITEIQEEQTEESTSILFDHDYEMSPVIESAKKQAASETGRQDTSSIDIPKKKLSFEDESSKAAGTDAKEAETTEMFNVPENLLSQSGKPNQEALLEVGEELMTNFLDDTMSQLGEQDEAVQQSNSQIQTQSTLEQEGESTAQDGEVDQGAAEAQEGSSETPTKDTESRIQKRKAATKKGDGQPWTCNECGKAFEKEFYLKRHMEGHMDSHECVKCGRKYVRKESLLKHRCPGLKKSSKGEADNSEDGDWHFCEFCGAKFREQIYLARHMATHTGEFTCEKCGRVYARKESLLSHLHKCDPEALKRKGISAFVCDICNKAFTKELSLKNHMVLHSGENKCETCGKSFTSVFSKNRHKCTGISVVEQDKPLFCEYCPKSFKTEVSLHRHMAKHTGTFFCMVCNKNYTKQKDLQKHLLECSANQEAQKSGHIKCPACDAVFTDTASYMMHYEEHTHPYSCKACNKRFLRKTNLQKHMCRSQEEGPFTCQVCQKEFSQYKYLKNHMAIHDEKTMKCQWCSKKFSTRKKLNKHQCINPQNGEPMLMARGDDDTVRFYPSNKSLMCQICGKNYSTVSNLNKHIKCHGEKTEKCDVCGKMFHLKIQVTMHKNMVHTNVRSFQCRYCDKYMKSKNSLYGHYAAYHKETVILYGCKQCGKKFRHKGNLKKHMLIHSDKKTFHCELCDKWFRHPEQKRHHELWHKHGNRFNCPLCDKSYVMEFELRRHINTHHGGLTYSCKYCETDCHFAHTMKRHLIRHHYAIEEWQQNPTQFVKSLARENKDVMDKINSINIAKGLSDMKTENPTTIPVNPMTAEAQEVHLEIIEQPAVEQPAEQQTVTFTNDNFVQLAANLAPRPVNKLEQQDLQNVAVEVVDHSHQMTKTHPITTLDPSILEGLSLLEDGGTSLAGGPVIVAEVQGLSSTGDEVAGAQTLIIQTAGGGGLGGNKLVSEEVAEALRSLTFTSSGEVQTVATTHTEDHIVLPTTAEVEGPNSANVPLEMVAQEDDGQGGGVIYVQADHTQVIGADVEAVGGAASYVQLQSL